MSYMRTTTVVLGGILKMAHPALASGGSSGGSSSSSSGSDDESAAAQLNDRYMKYTFYALGALAFFVCLYRCVLYAVQYIRTITSVNDKRQRYYLMPNEWFAGFKRHLFYAPMLRRRHNREFRLGRINGGTLPARLHMLVLVAWLGMNVVFSFYRIPWDRMYQEGLDAFVSRTGRLAVVNMIPIVIMAGRNNPLIILLNVPFDTFNKFHRWVGRMVVGLAVAHVVGWAVQKVKTAGWKAVEAAIDHSNFIQGGLIVTVAFVALFLHSPSVLRRAAYELFLYTHIALVVAGVYGLYLHTDSSPVSRRILYYFIGLWVLERCARLIILVYRNFGPNKSWAVVEALPGDACRVTVSVARPWKYRPGQYMFLYIPAVGWWTSHPFTVAWSSESRGRDVELAQYPGSSSKSATPGKDVPMITVTGSGAEKPFDDGYSIATPSTPSDRGGDNIVNDDNVILAPGRTTFSSIIRRRHGFTSRLYDTAARQHNRTLRAFALAEGPYNTSSAHKLLGSYGTTLLIAGGVGITHMVGYVRSLVAAHAEGGISATRRILLVWVIRDPASLDWIHDWMNEILSLPGRRQVLRIQLFVTRPTRASEMMCSPSQTVRMFPGRPNLRTLLDIELKDRVGAMAVCACGPGALTDEVRNCVRDRQHVANLDYVEEAFTW